MTYKAGLSPLERIPPHAIETGLLPQVDWHALRQRVLDRAEALEPSRIGTRKKPGLRPDIRNSLTLALAEIEPWLPLLRERIGARLPAVCARFGVAERDVGRLELEVVVYRDGAFFRRHIDTRVDADPEMRKNPRVLSAVYYVHTEPRGFAGGALRLYPATSTERHLDIEPQGNALLVFPSWAPHEVMPVECPSGAWEDARLAINCWIRRAAPRDEAAQ
jgi:Rps23 Pro-64 3,4-dihydroxylase Tpa1-like proline 4-hydroxylase